MYIIYICEQILCYRVNRYGWVNKLCIESEEWVGYGIVFNYCLLLRWWNRMAILLPPAFFPPTQQKNQTTKKEPQSTQQGNFPTMITLFFILFSFISTLHYNWRIYLYFILIENCIEFYIHNAGMKLIKNEREREGGWRKVKKGGEYNEGGFSV